MAQCPKALETSVKKDFWSASSHSKQREKGILLLPCALQSSTCLLDEKLCSLPGVLLGVMSGTHQAVTQQVEQACMQQS